ncbi:hypothetical protein L1030_25035, partial [Escherichia coli]|nr:hypothetical protein [Escherichia coli]
QDAFLSACFPLSLWCRFEIRTDHPCSQCALTLREMHTIMQMMLEVINPCSSLSLALFLSVLYFT